jgi:hypothetical protein
MSARQYSKLEIGLATAGIGGAAGLAGAGVTTRTLVLAATGWLFAAGARLTPVRSFAFGARTFAGGRAAFFFAAMV